MKKSAGRGLDQAQHFSGNNRDSSVPAAESLLLDPHHPVAFVFDVDLHNLRAFALAGRCFEPQSHRYFEVPIQVNIWASSWNGRSWAGGGCLPIVV